VNALRLRPLACVETRHEYFADGRCRAMRFRPTPRCREWISDFELVARANDHSLAVHVPEHRLADLRADVRSQPPSATLDFDVEATDPAFAFYTEDPATQTARLPLADASTREAWPPAAGERLTLQWHARRSIWCYWLLGEWEEKVLAIVDTQGKREFYDAGLQLLDPAQSLQAPCFRSRVPLALCERAPPGLQLRAGHSTAASRVVVSQLPAPRPSALQYELGKDGHQAVSEIFVSR
jgi:hypothetical protein